MKTKEDLFIERINQKQRGAFYELFRDFYDSLVLFAMKYVGEQGEAEDIVQDLFVAVWEKKDNFLSYNSFRIFLYNSVRNTCLNSIKHRKVEEKYADYSFNHAEFGESEDWDILEEEIYRKLFKAIDELPPRCREVFLLSLDGKKNGEIATELHIALLTVKTQKKKAVAYLRQRLGHLFLLLFLL
ncbi:MAG: RNA polymerase sigma-70 factor [Odoribacter sp.]